MKRSKEQIIDYFREFIFGFIYGDIERCIEAKANYVVALALLSYTEYIGGLISGNLGLRKKSPENFRKALEYFPKDYDDFDSSIKVEYKDDKGKTITETGIYSLFRCGMVHEYFIKGFAIIYNNPDHHTDEHIGILKKNYKIERPRALISPPYPNNVLEFHTNEYFRDFKLAVKKILKLLTVDKDQELLKGFNKSLDRLYSRKIL